MRIDDGGELVRRDGTVIGRIESMTLNLEVGERGTIGGVGTPSGTSEQDQFGESQDGGTGETKPLFDAPSIEDQHEARLWDTYQQTIPNGKRYELTNKRKRIIKRALNVRSVDECEQAIRGLAASQYHLEGGYLDIKYALGLPSESPDERIDRMAAKSSQTPGTLPNPSAAFGKISSYDQHSISEHAQAILDWLKHPDEPGRAYDAETAIKRLAERYGLEVAMDLGAVADLRILDGGRASSDSAVVAVARHAFGLDLEGPARS